MMKLLGIATIVIGTIAIAPSITLADNVSENTQSVTQSSTIVGSGNLVITDTQQSSIGIQNSRRSGGNISGNSQKINARTVVVGNRNIDIKKIVQEAIDAQQQ